MISLVDVLGFVAALLTLVAFAQARMLPMRLAAIAANIAFISYGGLGGHWPVLALHLVLLPLNAMRLAGELLRMRGRSSSTTRTQPAAGMMDWL